MFNLSFYKKKLKKLLLPINKILGSFFNEIERSKSQSSRQKVIKKKLISLDNKIESFFDKFKNLKKFNQNKKTIYQLNTKFGASVAFIVVLFFSYFFIPAFYNKNEIKKILANQVSDKYKIDIRFNEKIKYGLFPQPFFYTKNLDIAFDDEILGNSNYVRFYIPFNNFFSLKKLRVNDVIFQNTEFNTDTSNLYFFHQTLINLNEQNKVIFKFL